MLKISPKARVSELADIEESVRGTNIIIGDDVVIDAFVKIKPVGGTGDIIIGNSCYINSGCVLYSGNGISIGEFVLIGPNCTIVPVNHEFYSKSQKIIEQRFSPSRGGIVIENDVWIGAGVIILDGAILRKGCVVGAGSIVNKELPEYSINIGNPVRTIDYRK